MPCLRGLEAVLNVAGDKDVDPLEKAGREAEKALCVAVLVWRMVLLSLTPRRCFRSV
jgi:hypothetical protein